MGCSAAKPAEAAAPESAGPKKEERDTSKDTKAFKVVPKNSMGKKEGKKEKKDKPKREKGYGDLPPHHPAAQQAKSIAKREVAEATEETKVVEEASRKVARVDAWFDFKHADEFPKVGTKICFRSMYRKYLDANKKSVAADSGAPVWWEVYEDTEKNGLAIVLKKKGKALRGEGQDCKMLGNPCADEWKAVMKAPGRYCFVNEEGRFLKPDKDGSMSVMPCDPEDMAVVKPFIWEVKTK